MNFQRIADAQDYYTEKQRALLVAIRDDQYQGGDSREDVVGNPVWSWSACEGLGRSAGGIMAALVKKGLAGVCGEKNPEERTCWLTEAGWDAIAEPTAEPTGVDAFRAAHAAHAAQPEAVADDDWNVDAFGTEVEEVEKTVAEDIAAQEVAHLDRAEPVIPAVVAVVAIPEAAFREMAICPRCGAVAHGEGVEVHFGYRNMGKGKGIRRQSHCRACRREESRLRRAEKKAAAANG